MKAFALFLLSAVACFATYTGKVKIYNTGTLPVTVKLWQQVENGYQQNYVVAANGSESITLTGLSEDASIDVFRLEVDTELVGASLIYSLGAGTAYKFLGSAVVVDENPPPPQEPDPTEYVFYVSGSPLPDTKVTWLTDDTTLTANLFREGVDKLVGATTGSGGSGGGGTNTETVAGAQLQLDQDAPTTGDMDDESGVATSDYSTEFNAVTGNKATSNYTVTPVTVAPSIFELKLPTHGGNITIDVNPQSVTQFASIFSWIKLIATFLLLIWFDWWVWEEFQKYQLHLGALQQAHGNTFAGTGGQATALVAAGLLAVLITSFPGMLWAYFDSAFTAFGTNTLGELLPQSQNFLAGGFYLIGLIFPLGLGAVLLAQYFVVRKAGVLIFGVAVIGAKFIVP